MTSVFSFKREELCHIDTYGLGWGWGEMRERKNAMSH